MNTFGINFIIRRNFNNKKIAHLYARITINGEQAEIALKGRVDPDAWSPKEEVFKGKIGEIKAWNKHIENIRFRLTEHFRALEDKGADVSAMAVKQAYEGKISKKAAGHTVLELMDYHNKINPDKVKPGTMKNYLTTREYVNLFIQTKDQKADLDISELDFQFITEFEHFIRNKPIKEHDRCEGNGVGKHLERFCKIVRLGKKLKWLPVYPFDEFKIKMTRTKVIKLTRDELRSIEEQDLSIPILVYVRDLFLFSCYTGLAYCDVMKLNELELTLDAEEKVWIQTYRQKSDQLSSVPLLNPAIALIEKYRRDPRSVCRNAIFPYVSNQEVNRSIKVIAEICGIKKYMKFHVGRHTFGTVVTLKNGVPIETVQKMMGHLKISTTQIYAEVDEEKIAGDMSQVDKKMLARKEA